ncbi:Predicted arabinose efflux permease, MFS family [Haloplanus vescus]|uniref:Predicted arabinose efflux permease, MFS family n=1 Tax=Haloplanus vescus TaxID=555874 RepID=A0A1H3VQK6_9EURY|nr:MFS transporter [Haloplanus vescus]SDZ77066.1 Predicted arabinose efflux permease, MFS family [Haloplanus vescus]
MVALDMDRRVVALGLARMADAIGNSFLIVVLPLYIASGQIPIEGLVGTRLTLLGRSLIVSEYLLVGLVLSLFGFLNSFSQPFTGRLSDRTGRRRAFILFGLLLLGAASGAYAFVSSYWLVVLLRVLQGVGAAFTIPCTVALVNELATSRDRGSNFGVFNTFRLIGFGFGPIVAGLVVEGYGFDAAFGVAVAGAAVSFLTVWAFVSDPDRAEAEASDDLSITVRGDDGLLDPVFALGLGTVAMGICIAMFATLEGRINDRLGQGTLWFGVQFGAVTLANVAFQIPVGHGADRYGRRPFILAGFCLLVPATIAQGYVLTPALMTLTRFVLGVAVALVFAPSLAVAGDLAREGESGTTLSVLTMAFGLGVAIGPLASGYLERFGFAVPFLAAGALAALALVVVSSQVAETGDPDARLW